MVEFLLMYRWHFPPLSLWFTVSFWGGRRWGVGGGGGGGVHGGVGGGGTGECVHCISVIHFPKSLFSAAEMVRENNGRMRLARKSLI